MPSISIHQKTDSIPYKTRYSLSFFFILVLFLSTIFLFSKRALEPTLSLYRDNNVHVSLAHSISPLWPNESDSFTNQPVLPVSHSGTTEMDDGVETVNGEFSFPGSDSESVEALGDNADDGRMQGSGNVTVELKSGVEGNNGVLSGGDAKSPVIDSKTVEELGDNGANSESVSAVADDGDDGKTQRSGNQTIELKSGVEGSNVEFSGEDEKKNLVSESVSAVGDNGGDRMLQVQGSAKCDLFVGTWVKDERYPLYESGSCPFVDEAFDCGNNGRPDSDYLKWRWKPDNCDLPRFNATDFLTRLRGKRLMLVGDSMNRNQFESMLCLLHEGLPDKSRMREIHGHRITKGRGYYVFKFMDYDCTVEFVRSHFLVKEGVRINGQGNSNPTLSIDQIDKTSKRWKRADILVFNTGHWWTHGKTARGKNYYKEGNYIYPEFDAVEAYRRALRTWANWILENLNLEKQLVFYRGYSSAHFRGGDWDSGGSCNGETEPILRGAKLDEYPLKMKVVEEVIRETHVPVKLLNVTKLTNFRKDGHPSIYSKSLVAGKKVSKRRQDCSHWCLPGVPDAWNELIYASLVFG